MFGIFAKIAGRTRGNDISNIGKPAQGLRNEVVPVKLVWSASTVSAYVAERIKRFAPLCSIPSVRPGTHLLKSSEVNLGVAVVAQSPSSLSKKGVAEICAALGARANKFSAHCDTSATFSAPLRILLALEDSNARWTRPMVAIAERVVELLSTGLAYLLNIGSNKGRRMYFDGLDRAACFASIRSLSHTRHELEFSTAGLADSGMNCSNCVVPTFTVWTCVPRWAAMAWVNVVEHLSACRTRLWNNISCSSLVHQSPLSPSAVMPIEHAVNCWNSSPILSPTTQPARANVKGKKSEVEPISSQALSAHTEEKVQRLETAHPIGYTSVTYNRVMV